MAASMVVQVDQQLPVLPKPLVEPCTFLGVERHGSVADSRFGLGHPVIVPTSASREPTLRPVPPWSGALRALLRGEPAAAVAEWDPKRDWRSFMLSLVRRLGCSARLRSTTTCPSVTGAAATIDVRIWPV